MRKQYSESSSFTRGPPGDISRTAIGSVAKSANYPTSAFQTTAFWIFVYRSRASGEFELLGVPWISAGVKLGALESCSSLSFAGGGLEVSLIRRIMRSLGRACFCIGMIKGCVSTTSAPTTMAFHSAPPCSEDPHNSQNFAAQGIKVPHYLTY